MAHFDLSLEEAQLKIDEYFEIVEGLILAAMYLVQGYSQKCGYLFYGKVQCRNALYSLCEIEYI